MRRYSFLTKESVYGALNKLRAAFLAAKDGNDVEEIIRGVLTFDERMKVGRRIQIAQMLRRGLTYREINKNLKVGLSTVNFVERGLRNHRRAFNLIEKREEKVERSYKAGSYRKVGGSKLFFKRTEYTGLKRKDISR
uniref:Transcriptional regulator n=1 Tax=candidate division WWE3 bacterium TaxID=2053526 RepID=A0A832E1U8_UNCKA